MGEKGFVVVRSTSFIGPSIIITLRLNMKSLCPPLLPQDMRTCSGTIGRLSCPCEAYVVGSTDGTCGACLHSFAHHTQSSTIPLQSSTIGLAPGRAAAVTSLFNHALKSTPRGAAALQETSGGLRKRHAVSTLVPISCHTVCSRLHRAHRVAQNRPLCKGKLHYGRAMSSAFVLLSLFHVGFGTMR